MPCRQAPINAQRLELHCLLTNGEPVREAALFLGTHLHMLTFYALTLTIVLEA